MVFSSLIFLFAFLPVVIIIYSVIKGDNAKLLFLLLCSLFFYFFGEQYVIAILLISATTDFVCSNFIHRLNLSGKTDKKTLRKRRFLLIFSIFINLSLLFYFKYYNFFLENFIAFSEKFGVLDSHEMSLIKIGLPLGISFYTFQSMSYTIDVYRKEIQATFNPIKFLSYVTMFPQLIAGPIVRYSDIHKDLENISAKKEDFIYGIRRFTLGLGKKVIIANPLSVVVDQVFSTSITEMDIWTVWLGVICYSFQIFFDFSGYSCMAIGIGRMLGFKFPENFNYPYVSKSIKEFWRRWHITLSSWFRDYLYIPIGGSRLSITLTYRNLLIVFLLCGLWHGASWNFIIWGLFHGIFLVFERLGLIRFLDRFPGYIRIAYVNLVVLVAWVFFRAENLSQSTGFISKMFGFTENVFDAKYTILDFIDNKIIITLILALIFSSPFLEHLQNRLKEKMLNKPILLPVYKLTKYTIILSVLYICVAILSSGASNPFIYFRF